MENSNTKQKSLENSSKGSKWGYNAIVIVVTILVLSYFYSMFFGTSSMLVLLDLQDKKEQLDTEYNRLQNENQKLQKKYFELRQLTPDADAF